MEFGRTWKDGAALTRIAEGLMLQCDYDEEFIAALKEAIPWIERRWDPKRNAWIIAYQHGLVVCRLLREHLNEYVIIRG